MEASAGTVSITLPGASAEVEAIVLGVDGMRDVTVHELEMPPIPPFVL